MDTLKPGSTWAGCEIVKLIGSGGFGQVYEVRDAAGARRALKLLDAEAGLTSKLQARLAQEGEALAMVDHTNVLRFYAAGIQDERVWLLLELVDGVSLREIEDECARPPQESVLRWTRQACEGLAAAHAVGVVHRDVKPENLLITRADVVKVIDFGLAKLNGWGVKTTHQRLLGTAFYMAPEQLRSQPADPRMDVYAMGLVLYEALAGAHPMMQLGGPMTMLTICGRQLTYIPPPLSSLVPEVPGDLSELVQRAIEKDASKRVATMSELAARLQEVLSRLLVHRRNAVRALPLLGREFGTQRTIPMPARQDPTSARSAGGTIKLQVVAPPPASALPSAAVSGMPPVRPSASLSQEPRWTGDRPAIVPPSHGGRRPVWKFLAATLIFLAIFGGLAALGVALSADDDPPAPRRR